MMSSSWDVCRAITVGVGLPCSSQLAGGWQQPVKVEVPPIPHGDWQPYIPGMAMGSSGVEISASRGSVTNIFVTIGSFEYTTLPNSFLYFTIFIF